jgi:hypothetical protein
MEAVKLTDLYVKLFVIRTVIKESLINQDSLQSIKNMKLLITILFWWQGEGCDHLKHSHLIQAKYIFQGVTIFID